MKQLVIKFSFSCEKVKHFSALKELFRKIIQEQEEQEERKDCRKIHLTSYYESMIMIYGSIETNEASYNTKLISDLVDLTVKFQDVIHQFNKARDLHVGCNISALIYGWSVEKSVDLYPF